MKLSSKRGFKVMIVLLALVGCFIAAQHVSAQAPPPPPSEKGTGSNKAPGGGAPIDGGLAVIIASVAGYSAWKFRKAGGGR
jgi:hypothetical protein